MKILIIRFSSFGDVVLTTPVIRAIKEKYPEAVIDFIVYNTFSEAISLNPEIRNLVIFDKKKSKDRNYIKDIINKLKTENYDYVIDLHSKFLSRIIGKSLENKNTQYCRYKKRKWWKTILVKAKLITYNADCTIVESYFTALKKLGISFSDKNIKNGFGDNLEFYIDKKITVTIKSVKELSTDLALLTFNEYDNINQVLEFKNKGLFIEESDLLALPEDEYYIYKLIGIDVYNQDGKFIGKIKMELEKNNIKAEVTGRPKHLYSIYRKMIEKEKKFVDL